MRRGMQDSVEYQALHQIFSIFILETEAAFGPETTTMVSSDLHMSSKAEPRAADDV